MAGRTAQQFWWLNEPVPKHGRKAAAYLAPTQSCRVGSLPRATNPLQLRFPGARFRRRHRRAQCPAVCRLLQPLGVGPEQSVAWSRRRDRRECPHVALVPESSIQSFGTYNRHGIGRPPRCVAIGRLAALAACSPRAISARCAFCNGRRALSRVEYEAGDRPGVSEKIASNGLPTRGDLIKRMQEISHRG